MSILLKHTYLNTTHIVNIFWARTRFVARRLVPLFLFACRSHSILQPCQGRRFHSAESYEETDWCRDASMCERFASRLFALQEADQTHDVCDVVVEMPITLLLRYRSVYHYTLCSLTDVVPAVPRQHCPLHLSLVHTEAVDRTRRE